MKDYSGWKKYADPISGVIIGIQSPDLRESISINDPNVVAWLAIPGNSAKLV